MIISLHTHIFMPILRDIFLPIYHLYLISTTVSSGSDYSRNLIAGEVTSRYSAVTVSLVFNLQVCVHGRQQGMAAIIQ